MEAVLKDLGVTTDPATLPDAKDGLLTFKAKRDGKDYTLRFVPVFIPPKLAKPDDKPPPAPEPLKQPDIVKLAESNAIRRAGGVIVAVEGKDKDSSQVFIGDIVKERKDIKTIGEYVKYCVEPNIDARAKAAATAKPGG